MTRSTGIGRRRTISVISSIAKFVVLPLVLAVLATEIHRRMTDTDLSRSVAFLAICFGGFAVIDYVCRTSPGPARKSARRILSSAVVVFDGGMNRTLLCRRSEKEKFYPGTYSIPGGLLEKGETVEECALREMKEETGLRVRRLQWVGSYDEPDRGIVMFVYCAITEQDVETDNVSWFDQTRLRDKRAELAPNTEDAIWRSRGVIATGGVISRIDYVIDTALANVRTAVQDIGGQLGWDHFLYVNTLGTIGVGMGILTLSDDPDSWSAGIVRRARETLTSRVHEDGGWGLKSIDAATRPKAAVSVAESTAIALLALAKSGVGKDDDTVRRGIRWLEDNVTSEGALGINRHTPGCRVFSSSLSLLAVHEIDRSHRLVDSLANWLRSSQLEDGGWPLGSMVPGDSGQTQSNIAATALATYALLRSMRLERGQQTFAKASSYMMMILAERDAYSDYSEVDFARDPDGGETYRLEVKYDTRALLLLALSRMTETFTAHEHRILGEIMGRFDSSRNWSHSLTPRKYPIWATYFNVLALMEARRKLARIARVMPDVGPDYEGADV